MKKIYFTVTNDLNTDQRMQRICTTLAENGYTVTLVGREQPASLPLVARKFKQQRLRCCFNKGKIFYLEFSIRLTLYLLFKKMDGICAIDLDTIHPCYFISRIKKIPRIYDAHELFTEMKEVITRPRVKKIWDAVERKMVPKFQWGYTVSDGIAEELKKRYDVNYSVIRNMPVLTEPFPASTSSENFILYQGAVNEGRGLEYLIPAMKWINNKLVICGDGNFMNQLKKLIEENNVAGKIELKGRIQPEILKTISSRAAIGIALSEKEGLNQWLALPNKFFDYIHAGIPQITMNFPEYRKINNNFEVAVLIDDLIAENIAASINELLWDVEKRKRLSENCLKARQELNWQQEEIKLVEFYSAIFTR